VSSESSCAVRLARHSQNAWARHVECVESSRVESSQVEFELICLMNLLNIFCIECASEESFTMPNQHILAHFGRGLKSQSLD